MAASKAAVIGLLQDAYVKRDRVAVITFSGNNARVIVLRHRVSSVHSGF
jgi:hypothetical protein